MSTKQTRPTTLYLLVGYPGSGKTTTSAIIHDLVGAVHIWADYERRAMFGDPTHSAVESRTLYDHLNKSTELLLAEGQSVVFDTNFNFRKDRDLLRKMAAAHRADVKLVWLKVSKAVARKRALSTVHAADNSYTDTMTAGDFERITSNLEPPRKDESPILLDGTKITASYVAEALHIPQPKTNRSAAQPNPAATT